MNGRKWSWSIRIAAFCVVIGCVFTYTSNVIGYSDNVHTAAMFEQFYDLPTDSVDVIWLGSSSFQEFIVPAIVFDEAGITSFNLSTGNLRVNAYMHLIKECERMQDPSVYFIDLRPLAADGYSGDLMRRATDSMRWSRNRLEAINYIYSNLEKYHPERYDDYYTYLFPFAKWHSRWNELNQEDFSSDKECFLGYMFDTRVHASDKDRVLAATEAEPEPITDETIQYLNDLLDYLDTLGKKVIFVQTPCCEKEDQFAKYNYAGQLIAERGYPVWDLNHEVDEIGLDYARDFADTLHVNLIGAEKFSRYLAEKLTERYGLLGGYKDSIETYYRKMSSHYWDRYWARRLPLSTDFVEYLQLLSELDSNKYAVFMAVRDIQGYSLTPEMTKLLKGLGFDQADILLEHVYHSFVGVLDNGGVYQQIGTDLQASHYEERMRIAPVSVDSMVLKGGNKAYIGINGKNYAVNTRGFNIVVWDKKDWRLIDSVSFDTHDSAIGCTRNDSSDDAV